MNRKLLNIIYTNSMAESVAFYEKLGFFRREDGEINDWWNEFAVGDATIALHWNRDESLPAVGHPDLNIQLPTDEFDALYQHVLELNPTEIDSLRGLGRYFKVEDPNGISVQFNELT